MKITYVIGYRHSPDRIMNLRRVLDWLKSFNNIDVIIIEQDKYSKISHLNLNAKIIFVKSDKPYNRSWAFNIAIKRTTNPIIVFGDCDLIMDSSQFVDSINQLNTFDVVSPYSSVLDLTPEESNMSINMMTSINRPGRGENDNQKINLCGGIVAFRMDSILKIGGWAENYFMGWGGEDDFQTHKVKQMGLTYREMPYKCFHLWHDRSKLDMRNYQKTIQTLQQLMILPKEKIESHIKATIGKIGFMNKYS